MLVKWCQQEFSFTDGGNAKWYSCLENNLVVSYEIKHTLSVWSSYHAPWNLPKGVENLCPYKNLYTDIYSSFIQDCPNLEATKMSVNRWMDKLWYLQTVKYYSALKRHKLFQTQEKGQLSDMIEVSAIDTAIILQINVSNHYVLYFIQLIQCC